MRKLNSVLAAIGLAAELWTGAALAQPPAAASAGESIQRPATPRPAAKAGRQKVPNLELDTRGTGEAPEAAGPNTSTSDVGTGDRSGSDGASASTLPPPPFETPAPAPPGSPRPPLQPGGVAPQPTPNARLQRLRPFGLPRTRGSTP